MPVDGPSYLVGRTDERVLTMFLSSTNYRCLWTGPKAVNLRLIFSKCTYEVLAGEKTRAGQTACPSKVILR